VHRTFRAARSARRPHQRLDHHQEATCAFQRGNMQAHGRAAHAIGAQRTARARNWVAAGARARSAHAIGVERIASRQLQAGMLAQSAHGHHTQTFRAAQSAQRPHQRQDHHQEATRTLSTGAHAGARARYPHHRRRAHSACPQLGCRRRPGAHGVERIASRQLQAGMLAQPAHGHRRRSRSARQRQLRAGMLGASTRYTGRLLSASAPQAHVTSTSPRNIQSRSAHANGAKHERSRKRRRA